MEESVVCAAEIAQVIDVDFDLAGGGQPGVALGTQLGGAAQEGIDLGGQWWFHDSTSKQERGNAAAAGSRRPK